MYTRQFVLDKFETCEHKLTPTEIAGRASVLARGYPYYGRLRSCFPKHWRSFCCMHSRSKNIDPRYARTLDGLVNFICDLGPVPNEMVNPTVGRQDHSIGYFPGNFSWQSKSENSSEIAIRKQIHLMGTNPVLTTECGRKHRSLASFAANNSGLFHVNELKSLTGRTCGRRIRDHVKNINNCTILNYKNRYDFYVQIN